MIFINFLSRHLTPDFKKIKINLSSLKQWKEQDYNSYQKKMFYQLFCVYENKLSYIDYCPETGQIGFLMVHPDLQRRGLGTQLIIKASEEIKTDELWLYGSWDNPFYLNAFNGSFRKRNPADDSISGQGFRIYKKDLIV